MDELAHRPGRRGDEILERPGDEPADAVGLAPVVAEGEFVEIGLRVLIGDCPMVRAQPPALEVGNRPVTLLLGILERFVGLRLHGHGVRSILERAAVVAGQTIARHCGSGIDQLVGKAANGWLVIVRRTTQADATSALGGHQDHRICPAPGTARPPNEAFVHLHLAAQWLATVIDQASAQLVQPGPGRFIGAKAQDALQVFGGKTLPMDAQLPDRSKPQL